MLKYHRKILAELQSLCNSLGATLDYTATHESKLKDRQKAHSLVSDVLFGVLVDHPDNDHRSEDLDKAYNALEKLKELTKKTYTDRQGYLKPEEQAIVDQNKNNGSLS